MDQSVAVYQGLAALMLLMCLSVGAAWVTCMVLGVVRTIARKRLQRRLMGAKAPVSDQGEDDDGAAAHWEGYPQRTRAVVPMSGLAQGSVPTGVVAMANPLHSGRANQAAQRLLGLSLLAAVTRSGGTSGDGVAGGDAPQAAGSAVDATGAEGLRRRLSMRLSFFVRRPSWSGRRDGGDAPKRVSVSKTASALAVRRLGVELPGSGVPAKGVARRKPAGAGSPGSAGPGTPTGVAGALGAMPAWRA